MFDLLDRARIAKNRATL